MKSKNLQLTTGSSAHQKKSYFNLSSLSPYLYILPLLIISGFFLYYSIGFTVYSSFFKWDGIHFNKMTFVGLDNYIRLFSDRIIRQALLNHLFYFVAGVGIQTVLGFLMAVLIFAKLRGDVLFKAILFMPVVMAPTIIAAIFRILLDANLGDLNNLLRSIGLSFLAVPWLGSPIYARWALVIVNVFEWSGLTMVLYYTAMLSIPAEIFEAAKIEGAGFVDMITRITFPLVSGATSMCIILGIIGSLKTFDIVMLLTSGGPGVATEFLNTYLYKQQVSYFNAGYASAIGIFIVILAMSLSVIQIRMYNQNSKFQ
ncbi:MAG: sugar ABC transporter permease [Anaerolineaceae bacterium]|nr:sugar ABC transporter permease [Anaerolineaceae bacterium]